MNYHFRNLFLLFIAVLAAGSLVWPSFSSAAGEDWSVAVTGHNKAGVGTAVAGPDGVWTSAVLGNGSTAGTVVTGDQNVWTARGGRHQLLTSSTVAYWNGNGETDITTEGSAWQDVVGWGSAGGVAQTATSKGSVATHDGSSSVAGSAAHGSESAGAGWQTGTNTLDSAAGVTTAPAGTAQNVLQKGLALVFGLLGGII